MAGEGGENYTPEFAVKDDWEVHWECREVPTFISIERLDGDRARSVAGLADSRGPERTGSTTIQTGGRYKIGISMDKGPWKITVFQNANRID